MIKASAPGRAGIVGNPTDMYGGSVISCSTRERATTIIEESDVLTITAGDRTQEIRSEADLHLAGNELDVTKAVIKLFVPDLSQAKFHLSASTEIPMQAGLAGSTAISVSILGAVLEYLEISLTRYEIAEAVRRVEADVMSILCGYQDQYMAVFGGLNYMDMRGKEKLAQTPDEPFATVEPLAEWAPEIPAILAHTGVRRHSGKVHSGVRERWLSGDREVVEGYLRIAELARLGKKAMILGDWEMLGALMNENHAIQRKLGGSNESVDTLIQAALDAGALGAKLAGAGGGGTIIALHMKPESIADALIRAGAGRILYPKPGDGLVVERQY